MSKLQKSLVATAVALTCIGGAQASPAFLPGQNDIFFQNFEMPYRLLTNCTAATCLAQDANAGNADPAGYARVNPAVTGNIMVGDVFFGILNVQNITPTSTGVDIYNSTPGNRFTGIFSQQVASLIPPATHANPATVGHITLVAGPDLFATGYLAAGEMFALFDNVAAFTSGATLLAGRTAATSGTPWATLGLAPGLNASGAGYAYTHDTLAANGINDVDIEAFFALNLIRGPGTAGFSYNAGALEQVNDVGESELGGTNTNILCGPGAGQVPLGSLGCVDMYGNSEIQFNPPFLAGTSPWMFASNDPFTLFQAVPEPATLALVGLALAGLGFRSRRAS